MTNLNNIYNYIYKKNVNTYLQESKESPLCLLAAVLSSEMSVFCNLGILLAFKSVIVSAADLKIYLF